MHFVKIAESVIDIDLEGENDSGSIIAFGTPEKMALKGESYTGQFLKRFLEPGPSWL